MDTNGIDSPKFQNPQFNHITPPSSDHPVVSVGQTPCPPKRRSLQFKDNQQKLPGEEIVVRNVYGNGWFPPSNVEVTESSLVNKHVIPTSGYLSNMTNPFLCLEENELCPMKVQKPSGFGLHLNRVVSSMNGCATILGQKSSEIPNPNTTIVTNSVSEPCFASTNPLEGISVNRDQPNLCDNGTHKQEIAQNGDLSSPSPYKRRKKVPITDTSHRRCNCLKSQCLKLYCYCFSAGEFCDKMCSCQDCYNTEDYEDTVSNVREKIQSRNPQAFVPKIQQDVGTCSTPSSARHKKGCKCKKSKCSKKYCECYQARIGCTDGCHCIGCENALGRKDEYVMKNGSVLQPRASEMTNLSSDTQLQNVPQQNDQSILHNMPPPIAPAIQQFPTYAEGAESCWYSPDNFLTPAESEMLRGSTFHANDHDINNEMMDSLDITTEDVMDSLLNELRATKLLSVTNGEIETTGSVHQPIDTINHPGGDRFHDMLEIPMDTTTVRDINTINHFGGDRFHDMLEIPMDTTTVRDIDTTNHSGGDRFHDMFEIPTDTTTVRDIDTINHSGGDRFHHMLEIPTDTTTVNGAVMSQNSSSPDVNVMIGRRFILQAVSPSFIDTEKKEKRRGEQK